MNIETQVLALFEEGNPIRDLDGLEPIDIDAAAYLATLEQRSSAVTQIETIPETKPPGKSRGPLIAAAVAAVALIVTIGVVLASRQEQPVVDSPDPVPTTIAVPTTDAVPTTIAETQTISPQEALDVSESFIAAHNAGDFVAVLALFTADATFEDSNTLKSARPDWEPRLVWDIAGEEVLLSPECAVTGEVPGETVRVRCEYGSQDAVGVAADSIVSITAILTITPEGISALVEAYSDSVRNYADIGIPFNAWVLANFPEDADAAGCCEAETIEESVVRGELRAQYAREWAIYLAENS